MGIDYLIDFGCEPKQVLTVEGLMGRLKGRDRAEAVIKLYRDHGDYRSPSEMGFEMVRRNADGGEDTEVIVVQDLLDAAAALEPWEASCVGCPANRTRTPFGCIGTINYPLSAAAERGLLDQLPDNEHPLVFMLLQRALQDLGYTGSGVGLLREQAGVFLESEESPERDASGVRVNGNQVFELLFLSGPIYPAHGALLLQFFGGISPDLEADTMMQIAHPPSLEWIDAQAPFLLRADRTDDLSVADLKRFFSAVYLAYRLGVPVYLDV